MPKTLVTNRHVTLPPTDVIHYFNSGHKCSFFNAIDFLAANKNILAIMDAKRDPNILLSERKEGELRCEIMIEKRFVQFHVIIQ